MSMAHAFASIEAAQREQVFASTWGHLAPKQNKKYRGTLVCSRDAFHGGRLVILKCDFAGLSSSPWSYDFFHDWANEHAADGTVTVFTGCFCNYKMIGTIQHIKL